ncbi:MAG: Prophage LambdaW5 baseplate assembly protein V [Rhodospirillaceae bacterium]|nr:MAG: Prophage LambdaW5 baseplate assembly protein V [Rhodospirillaceae bacterium]
MLGTLYQTKHAAPGDRATVTRTVWEDGATLDYDRAAHRWRLLLPSSGEIVLAIGDAAVLTLRNDRIQVRCGASTLT